MSIEELPPDAPITDDEDKSVMSVSEPPDSPPKAGEGEAG